MKLDKAWFYENLKPFANKYLPIHMDIPISKDNLRYRLINLINVLSFMVGLENMRENQLQSAHNDVQAANNAQAEYLLNEINRRFDEQNKILEEQNGMLAELLKRINGGK